MASGLQALHVACGQGNAQMVEQLLGHGAQVNALTVDRQRSALWFAAGSGHLRCVELCMAAGAELDHTDSSGSCALRCGKQ